MRSIHRYLARVSTRGAALLAVASAALLLTLASAPLVAQASPGDDGSSSASSSVVLGRIHAMPTRSHTGTHAHRDPGADPSADLATSIVGPSMICCSSSFYHAPAYYTITVHNNGPDTASNVVVSDQTPSNIWPAHPTTFYCVESGTSCGGSGNLAPGVCTTPPVGSTGLVRCTTASLAGGASWTITMGVAPGFYLHNQLICDSATASSISTPDPNPVNNTATTCARVI